MVAQPVQTTFGKEGGHWYLPNGSPFYTVIGKNGNERPVTLRDARPVNAVPSVTLILGVADKPGLRHYFRRQMYDATFTTPRLPSMTDDEHFAECCRWADEHALLARSKGTELHAAIEDDIKGQPSLLWAEHIAEIKAKLEAVGIDLKGGEAEHTFACPLGYGGKTDYIRREPEIVIDFKSKDRIEDKKQLAWDEHLMQLAAYETGTGMENARCLNVFVGIEDKEVRVLEYDRKDLDNAFQMFKALLTYWRLKNKL